MSKQISDSRVSPDIVDLWGIVWRGRMWLVLSMLMAGGVGAAYGFFATPWYRAQVVLIPAENSSLGGLSGALSQLGGLAGVAGLSIGSGGKEEPLAVLRSRDFVREFIEDGNLLPVLFADKWDSSNGRWKTSAQDSPDVRDALDLFDRKIRRIDEDRKEGTVTLTIDWTDPALAGEWANEMIRKVNEQTRARAIKDARENVDFLQKELEGVGQVGLRQSAGRLLEAQLERLMIARGRQEFAFRVVDTAVVPKKRYWPRRTLIVVLSSLLGAVASAAVLLASGLAGFRNARADMSVQG